MTRPQLLRRRPGPPRSAESIARMDRLAAHIADGHAMNTFTKAEGIASVTTTRLWRMICADLGAQAI